MTTGKRRAAKRKAAGARRTRAGTNRVLARLSRAEDDLRRFRLAMDGSADMIVLVDRATMKFVDANSTICRLLGYTREELLKMRPEDILPVGRAELEAAYDRQIADPSVPGGLKSYYRCKDGSKLPFESKRQVLRSGNNWLISVVSRDIRERIQAETALHDSEARFRALTDLSSDWYWEQDREFRFTFMSGRFGDTTGMNARHYLGRRRWDEPALNLSEADWARHRAQLERHEPFRDFEIQRRIGEGRSLWVTLSGEPIFDAEGRFAGYRGIGRDVTAQRRGEQLLRLEHHVALSLADAADAASGLKAVLRAFCEAEGWACGRYFEVDEAAGVLRFREAWCIDDAVMRDFVERSRPLVFKPGEGLAGLAWQSAEPIWSSDTRADPRVHATQLQIGTSIRGAFVFTVGAAGRILGVVSFTSQAVREPDERLRQAALVIGRQIGQFVQRKQAEEAVRESEARFRSLTQMSSDFFWETDTEHRFTQMVHGPNDLAKFGRALLGKTAWELPSRVPDDAGWATLRASFEAHEPFRDFEFARPWPDGGTRYFTVSGEPRFAPGGSFIGYRGVGRETTEIAITREHIASLAYSDALTGLANRTSLGPAFDQAVERARRRSTKLAAMFIDLDGFKPVNDAYGHSAGDRILIEVARRLRASLRASDLVARLGGDEFFVVLEDVHEDGVLEAVARKLLVEIARPYELASNAQARLSASMGISIFPDDAADAAGVMKHADMAMYAAKQAGKNAFRFYVAGETADPLARTQFS
jgi:diguanylate cyclase (GGDEF)-like protein/PAS domain S-box-containing protein